jgi:trans-aconitate 2-methyltransferase
MSRDTWNPAQYERFRDERSRPFHDLLALVRPRQAMQVVDLGCGTGKLTLHLHRTLGARETLGLDASDAMLAETAQLAGDGLRFEKGDIAAFAPGPSLDLVFSNAALHWLPDHPGVFARLAAALRAGGQLAVQVPANYDHPSHVVAAEVAAEPPFRDALGGPLRGQPGVLLPEQYAAILARLGFREQHVRLQVYAHPTAARDEVVEWMKGTLLTAYERQMPADLYRRFLARYRERLLPRLEDDRPYLFLFKRILMWAQHRERGEPCVAS